MDYELAFFCTIALMFLTWLYLTGPWRQKPHLSKKVAKSPTVNRVGENQTNYKVKDQSREDTDTSSDDVIDREDADGLIHRKHSDPSDHANASGRSSRKSSKSSRTSHKLSAASLMDDDVADLIIDPRDIKPVPVGLRVPTESSDPEAIKQYVKDLRAHQEDDMTEEEMEQEREVQKQQLAEIFRLMQNSQDKFGMDSLDDVEEQMKLYAKT